MACQTRRLENAIAVLDTIRMTNDHVNGNQSNLLPAAYRRGNAVEDCDESHAEDKSNGDRQDMALAHRRRLKVE